MLRWHVCRVNFARKIFFELRYLLTKNAPNFPRNCLSLYSVGQKKSRKIPAKFPCKNQKKNHRRASAGAQAEQDVKAENRFSGISYRNSFVYAGGARGLAGSPEALKFRGALRGSSDVKPPPEGASREVRFLLLRGLGNFRGNALGELMRNL